MVEGKSPEELLSEHYHEIDSRVIDLARRVTAIELSKARAAARIGMATACCDQHPLRDDGSFQVEWSLGLGAPHCRRCGAIYAPVRQKGNDDG